MKVRGVQGTHEGHPYGGGDTARRHSGSLLLAPDFSRGIGMTGEKVVGLLQG